MRENQISRFFVGFIYYICTVVHLIIFTHWRFVVGFCVLWVILSDFDNKLLTFYFGECKITLEGIEVIV